MNPNSPFLFLPPGKVSLLYNAISNQKHQKGVSYKSTYIFIANALKIWVIDVPLQ